MTRPGGPGPRAGRPAAGPDEPTPPHPAAPQAAQPRFFLIEIALFMSGRRPRRTHRTAQPGHRQASSASPRDGPPCTYTRGRTTG